MWISCLVFLSASNAQASMIKQDALRADVGQRGAWCHLPDFSTGSARELASVQSFPDVPFLCISNFRGRNKVPSCAVVVPSAAAKNLVRPMRCRARVVHSSLQIQHSAPCHCYLAAVQHGPDVIRRVHILSRKSLPQSFHIFVEGRYSLRAVHCSAALRALSRRGFGSLCSSRRHRSSRRVTGMSRQDGCETRRGTAVVVAVEWGARVDVAAATSRQPHAVTVTCLNAAVARRLA